MRPFIVESVVAFDAVQRRGEVSTGVVHTHQPMKMIRQDDISKQMKRMDILNAPHSIEKQRDVIFRLQVRDAIMGNASDEHDGVGNVVSSEIGHCSPPHVGQVSIPALSGGFGKPPYVIPLRLLPQTPH